MRKEITIAAEPRSTRGKNEARRLRVAGRIPATLYGTGKDPVAVAVSPKEVNKILHSTAGHNTIFNVQVAGGETTPVMIIDWQHEPVKGFLLHIDLKRIDLTQRLNVKVPVHTTGEPKGVKQQGGVHEIVTREVEVNCLPDEIPEGFTVDVIEMMLGDNLRASQLPLTGSMKLVSPPDQVISHVVAIRETVAETPAEGAEAVATPAATSEPEVIKKGKKEEEGAPEGKEAKESKKK